MSKVTPRYARALVQALTDGKILEESLPVLKALASLPAELAARLDDATIPAAERADALRAAMGHPAPDSIWERLIALLAHKRRLGLIDKICQEALDLQRDSSGVAEGVIRSRTVLPPVEVAALESALTREGRKVHLTSAADPGIVGGFRVQVGSTVLDATINNQLQQARRALLSA